MIAIRIHSRDGEKILAACDEEMVGKTFSEGDFRLKITEGFYLGETVTEEILIERMKSVSIMNLVGSAVDIAIREGYVSNDAVIVIDGVKHAQAVR